MKLREEGHGPAWVDEVIFLQMKVAQREPLRAWPCHPTMRMDAGRETHRRPLGGQCTTRAAGEDMTHDSVTCRAGSGNMEKKPGASSCRPAAPLPEQDAECQHLVLVEMATREQKMRRECISARSHSTPVTRAAAERLEKAGSRQVALGVCRSERACPSSFFCPNSTRVRTQPLGRLSPYPMIAFYNLHPQQVVFEWWAFSWIQH